MSRLSKVIILQHFRSHDKDGRHTIRSTISENPMLHANFMALCFTQPRLLLMEAFSDVTIIESEIEIEFFLKIELNQN